jgi:hypothetical protein
MLLFEAIYIYIYIYTHIHIHRQIMKIQLKHLFWCHIHALSNYIKGSYHTIQACCKSRVDLEPLLL